MTIKCTQCGKRREMNKLNESPESYIRRRPFCVACGHKNRLKTLGEHGPGWKGGRHVDHDGYVRVLVAGRYAKEHQVVWKNAYGHIPVGYVIHHKDGNKENNSIDNLECLPKKEHDKLNPMIPYAAKIRWGHLTVDEARQLI